MVVDIVYTFVDTTNNDWQKSFQYWQEVINPTTSSVSKKRFQNCNELKYSLRSVSQFVKFIRKVWIVVESNDHIPSWLDTTLPKTRLQVVTHSDIYPKKYQEAFLPTFNSVSIELHIHKISGLAENYIYMNDDMFFGRKLSKSDFLTKGGKGKIFMAKNIRVPIPPRGEKPWKTPDYNFLKAMMYTDAILNKHFRRDKRHFTQHLPYLHNIQVDKKLYSFLVNNNYLETTCSKFRENRNVKTQSLFYPYFSNYMGKSVLDFKSMGFKESIKHREAYKKVKHERPKLFCLNSLKELDSALLNFYKTYFPKKSEFEKF